MTIVIFPSKTARVVTWALAAAAALLAACSSTPCHGDSCPDACDVIPCEESAETTGSGRFGACSSNASCDHANGFACVDGVCRHACVSHFDCGGVARCEALGDHGTYCALTSPPTEPGGFYSNCPEGRCASTGFFCLGAGIGDTDSYCTRDCASDRDCAAGFYCEVIQDQNTGMDRNVCVPRRFCAECASDADCLAVPGGICARDASGEKRCTKVCDPERNSCPWGAATECRVTDDERGVPTCQHRSGACRGEGNGCDPCWRDADCALGACIASTYTDEHWCVDQMLPCSCAGLPAPQGFCAGANGCPDSPSGFPMVCLDQGTAGGGVCLGVNIPGSAANSRQLSCWR